MLEQAPQKPQQKTSKRLRLQKTLGVIMQTLLLSPNRSSALLKVDVEVPAIPQSPEHPSPTATVETSIKLLSSPNVEDNRQGLQLLITLTKVNKIVSSPRTNISQRILTGGGDRTTNRIRSLLLSFLCKDVDIHAIPDDDDASVISALSDVFFGASHDDSTWEDDSDFGDGEANPAGRHYGSLHGCALQVVVHCLENVSSSHSGFGKTKITIDYSSAFWISMIQTMNTNIESANNLEVCGLSLRCLRLLVSLDSNVILPMLKYTMLPYIMNLKECRDANIYPLIQDEATKLLKQLV